MFTQKFKSKQKYEKTMQERENGKSGTGQFRMARKVARLAS